MYIFCYIKNKKCFYKINIYLPVQDPKKSDKKTLFLGLKFDTILEKMV